MKRAAAMQAIQSRVARTLALSLALATASGGCQNRDRAPQTQPQSVPRPVSFRDEVLPVMIRDCANAEGCHGDKPTDSVSLDLRPDAAYSQLVGAPAEARKGAFRVKRGDPGASFVIDKLEGTLRSGEGKPMPIDVKTGAPLNPSPVPLDYVEKVLKPWILAGAANN